MRPLVHRLQGVLLLLLWVLYAVQAFKGWLILPRVPHPNVATFLNVVVLAPGLVLLGTWTVLWATQRTSGRPKAMVGLLALHVVLFVALSPQAVREPSLVHAVVYWTVQVGQALLAVWVVRHSRPLLQRPADPVAGEVPAVGADRSTPPAVLADRNDRLCVMLYAGVLVYVLSTMVPLVVANVRLHQATVALAQGRVTDVLVARQSLDDEPDPRQDPERLDRMTDGPVVVDPAFVRRLHDLLAGTWAFPASDAIDPFARLVIHGPDVSTTLEVSVRPGYASIDGQSFYLVNWDDAMGLVAAITPPPTVVGPTTTDRRTVVHVWRQAPGSVGR